MEFSGEEKRIQALFREVKFEDCANAPSFARTWHFAESSLDRKGSRRISLLPNSPGLLTALLVVFLVAAFAWWPQLLQRAQRTEDSAKQLSIPHMHSLPLPAGKNVVAIGSDEGKSNKQLKSGSGARALLKTKRTLAVRGSSKTRGSLLSSWQSPTARLLRSPGDELLTEVPQLNQAAQEMQLFLSKLN